MREALKHFALFYYDSWENKSFQLADKYLAIKRYVLLRAAYTSSNDLPFLHGLIWEYVFDE